MVISQKVELNRQTHLKGTGTTAILDTLHLRVNIPSSRHSVPKRECRVQARALTTESRLQLELATAAKLVNFLDKSGLFSLFRFLLQVISLAQTNDLKHLALTRRRRGREHTPVASIHISQNGESCQLGAVPRIFQSRIPPSANLQNQCQSRGRQVSYTRSKSVHGCLLQESVTIKKKVHLVV